MNGHRSLLLLLTTILLSGCFGGGGFSHDPAEVRRQVADSLNQISFNISAEDIFEASKYIHDSFELQPAVAQKFNVGPFEGKGRQAFRSFFERVADKYGDLTLTFTVQRIDVNNDIATAYVQVQFSGHNTEAIPPAELNFTENDILVFDWNGQIFALTNWGENDHNQGGGGGF